jgi:hypothetical protein
MNTKEDQLHVITWNVEDFTKLKKLISNTRLMYKLRQQHILLLQEWNNKDKVGEIFISNLIHDGYKNFEYVSVDRVAVVYNTSIFDSEKTIDVEIPLEYESPSFEEQAYTTGRQKSNILTILYPKDKNYNPICVISFHLSAYIPEQHPGFHKKQLTKLIIDAKNIIEKNIKIKNYDILIAGDTNYRIPIKEVKNIHLKNELLNSNIEFGNEKKKLNKEFIHKLKNVCTNGKCENKTTQNFRCVHEKSMNKRVVRGLSIFFNKAKLDLMLTNLTVINAKVFDAEKIDKNIGTKLCDISDHTIISAVLKRERNASERNSNVSKRTSYVLNRETNVLKLRPKKLVLGRNSKVLKHPTLFNIFKKKTPSK